MANVQVLRPRARGRTQTTGASGGDHRQLLAGVLASVVPTSRRPVGWPYTLGNAPNARGRCYCTCPLCLPAVSGWHVLGGNDG